jgi:imidazolonepropionase-like amidohydrolase
VQRSVGLKGVLAAGQRSIEHLDGYVDAIEADDSPLRNQAPFVKRFFLVKVDEGKMRSICEETRRAGTWNVPTLVTRQMSALPAEEVQARMKRPEMKYVDPGIVEYWGEANERVTGSIAPEDFARLPEAEKVRGRLVKQLHEAGARLLVGTDTPNPFVVPGFSMVEELQNFVRAGLTPYQAIKAGTREAAEFMNASDEFGTVSIGKRADLILVEANPLEKIANLERRTGVMVRGRWLTSSDLQQQLDALASSY